MAETSLQKSDFEIKLPLFEGPFDLLLFFIERDELDIYQIPISHITNEFLKYIHALEQMNMEVAGEFILVAATLMRIKARSLLPNIKPENADGSQIDSQQELIRHLLEYKKFKDIAPTLAEMELLRTQIFTRPAATQQLQELSLKSQTDFEWQTLDLYKLLKTYQKLMGKYALDQARPIHTIVQYPYSIENQKAFILEILEGQPRLDFNYIIHQSEKKIAAIYNFLAILELLQSGLIGFWEGEGYNNFWIVRVENIEILPE